MRERTQAAVASRDLTWRVLTKAKVITSTRPVTLSLLLSHFAAHLIIIMTNAESDVLRTIKNKIKGIYGDDAVSWFDNSYIVDWQVSEWSLLKNNAPNERMSAGRVVVLGLFIFGQFIRAQPTFERDFSPNDPLIQHPHTSER